VKGRASKAPHVVHVYVPLSRSKITGIVFSLLVARLIIVVVVVIVVVLLNGGASSLFARVAPRFLAPPTFLQWGRRARVVLRVRFARSLARWRHRLGRTVGGDPFALSGIVEHATLGHVLLLLHG
jgi:hypothetical protein